MLERKSGMNSIITKKWLLARLYDPNLVILDCRFHLNDPKAGVKSYEEAHIPGALFFDLERELSGPKFKHGGRHPLPPIEQFVSKLGLAGIDDSVHVIAYDDQGGAMASRLWWLLQYVGHSKVSIMEEGFTSWKEAGFPITNAKPQVTIPRQFTPAIQNQMLVTMDEVKQVMKDPNVILIDSREKIRYLGEHEPIDPVAGHIPGALNLDWKLNLDSTGKWLNNEQLRNRFVKLDTNKDLIVYCGSGVTACPNILALRQAGFVRIKLYAGSWSDWISYPDNPVATGEE